MKDWREEMRKTEKLTVGKRSLRPSMLFSLEGNIVSSLIARASLLLKLPRHFACKCHGRFARR